jgi:hypothetical protein
MVERIAPSRPAARAEELRRSDAAGDREERHEELEEAAHQDPDPRMDEAPGRECSLNDGLVRAPEREVEGHQAGEDAGPGQVRVARR